MRLSFDAEPRLMALTEAEMQAQLAPRTSLHNTLPFGGALSDVQARWSRHALRAAYGQLGQVVRRPR
jgi:hypothetical protein